MKEIEKLKQVLKESDAYAAVIFGSYARGEEYNDIDVAVFSDAPVEDIVREAPGIFDIQRFDKLPMYVRHRVLEGGERFTLEMRIVSTARQYSSRRSTRASNRSTGNT